MTDEHKALVARLRATPDVDFHEAAAAIEALSRADDEYESVCEALQAAEGRAAALLAELRAKETEIESLSARLDAQGSELADYAKTVQELRRRKP